MRNTLASRNLVCCFMAGVLLRWWMRFYMSIFLGTSYDVNTKLLCRCQLIANLFQLEEPCNFRQSQRLPQHSAVQASHGAVSTKGAHSACLLQRTVYNSPSAPAPSKAACLFSLDGVLALRRIGQGLRPAPVYQLSTAARESAHRS